MNIPKIELMLANTNSTVVRQKLPRTTYGSKNVIIQIVRDAVDMQETVRNVYAFALEGDPRAPRHTYLSFLIEYTNDHFDLFDDCQMNMGNTSREFEVISIMHHMSLLANPNHLLYSIKRLPHELRDMPPLQAACLVKSQSFKPLLPNWQAFLATLNEDQQLYPKSCYEADDWDELYDKSKFALRKIKVTSIDEFVANFKDFEQLNFGIMRGHELRVFICVKGVDCRICFVPVSSADSVYLQIQDCLPEFFYGDILPRSVYESHGQRLLSLNKIDLLPVDEDKLSWLLRR